MNVLETEWWSLGIPAEWWTEHEDDVVIIADQDGVGTIEISTLRKDSGDFDAEEVRHIARDNAETSAEWSTVSCGDFTGYCSSWLEEEAAVREWYLARGGVLLFVTYCCEPQQQGLDDAAVDEILGTLEVQTQQ